MEGPHGDNRIKELRRLNNLNFRDWFDLNIENEAKTKFGRGWSTTFVKWCGGFGYGGTSLSSKMRNATMQTRLNGFVESKCLIGDHSPTWSQILFKQPSPPIEPTSSDSSFSSHVTPVSSPAVSVSPEVPQPQSVSTSGQSDEHSTTAGVDSSPMASQSPSLPPSSSSPTVTTNIYPPPTSEPASTEPVSSSDQSQSVSRSSTEAEYRALANAAAEVLWIKNLLHELNLTLAQSPVLLCDNLSATYVCKNPVFHSRTKHLALDYFFVRELVTSGTLVVRHIPSSAQLADLLTKSLGRHLFLHFRSKIGVSDGSSILRGRVKDICG
nr:uncharacterized protein LOC109146716 [Ipomoea trifida]